MQYLPLLRKNRNNSLFDNLNQDRSENELLAELIDEIQGLDKDITTSKSLLQYLSNINQQNPDSITEFPFFDGEKFIAVNILEHDGSYLLHAEFSELGEIEVLIKNNSGLQILFFVADNEIKEKISSNSDVLKTNIGSELQAVSIHLKSTIKNKMIEINQYYSINSAIDIKI